MCVFLKVLTLKWFILQILNCTFCRQHTILQTSKRYAKQNAMNLYYDLFSVRSYVMFMQWLVSTLMTILIFMRRGVMWWGSFLLSSYAQIKQWKAWWDDLVQLADTRWRHWSWTSSLSQSVRRRNLKKTEKGSISAKRSVDILIDFQMWKLQFWICKLRLQLIYFCTFYF